MTYVDTSQEEKLKKINRELLEKDIAKKAEELGYPYIHVGEYNYNNFDVLKIVSARRALETKLIPFEQEETVLRVATVNPLKKETQTLIDELKLKTKRLEIYLCSEVGFNEAYENYGSDIINRRTVELKQQFDEDIENLKLLNSTFAELEERLPGLVAGKAINEIEIAAMKVHASDVHFQPMNDGVVLRFRIDGILHSVLKMDIETAKKIIMRIKYDAGMQSNIADVPQDGRLSFMANDRLIDVRVSTLPSETVESIVLRLLDSRKGIQDFRELGFSSHSRENIETALSNKNGLILVTGPTGSGKTTTLYSMLSELNLPEKKLVTLEDPIEYHIEGISQSPVNETKGFSFTTGLKALLRHDPDVVLIGEIRELSTARLVSEASLTGHIVFTSLHTNSAVGAVSRLRNLGLEDFNIATALNAVFAQRLVRKICGCAHMKPLLEEPKLLSAITRLKDVFPNLKLPKEVPEKIGCDKCYGTGYSGRGAICESFIIDEKLKKLILKGHSDIEITKFLKENTNFIDLFEDGVLKVMKGDTTLEEIYRVAGSS